MRTPFAILTIVLLFLLKGCTSTASVATEYRDYEYSGEALAIAPFTFDYIESKRRLLVFKKTETTDISTTADGDSVGVDFVNEYLTNAFEEESLFKSAIGLDNVDTADWQLETFYDLESGKELFNIHVPSTSVSVDVDSDSLGFLLIVGFAEADFREEYRSIPSPTPGGTPTRQRLPGTFTMHYVLWHVADSKPFSWGIAEAAQTRLRVDRPDEWQSIATGLVLRITKGTPFYVAPGRTPQYVPRG